MAKATQADRNPAQAGREFQAKDVKLATLPPAHRISLRAPAASIDALSRAIGLALPQKPKTSASTGNRTALWLGPDEWLVFGGREEDYPDAWAAVDVSASRVCFELSGEGAVDVLARGCALDLHPSVFPPGSCAQTLLARAQVILYRPSEHVFRLLVRPSYADYLRAWLRDAGAR
jgi:sarcosine oxidase, subunit gamma